MEDVSEEGNQAYETREDEGEGRDEYGKRKRASDNDETITTSLDDLKN